MGFFSNLIGKFAESSGSAITTTTDTIAKQYTELKSSTELTDKDIYRKIIELRYSVIPLKEKWRHESMLEAVDNMSSLKLLVFEIIMNESSDIMMAGNDALVKILDIIQERLKTHGLT